MGRTKKRKENMTSIVHSKLQFRIMYIPLDARVFSSAFSASANAIAHNHDKTNIKAN